MNIGGRLCEERERLGIGLGDFADKIQVDRRTQSNYEKDKRSPDADYLARAAALGVDTLYVLTGSRSVTSGYNVEGVGHDSPRNIDLSLLRDVVQAIEEGMEENHLYMKPDKKAELVVAVYDLYASMDAQQVDKKAVLRLVKSAA